MTPPEPNVDVSALLAGSRELTSSQVTDAVGIPMYKARRYWRALGFANVPDGEREFTNADVEALSTLRSLVTDGVLDEHQTVELMRTVGRAAARLANTVADGMNGLLNTTGSSGSQRRSAAWDIVERTFPDIEELLLYSWRRHLAVALQRRQPHLSAAGPLTATVGFADLVGFTRLSQQLSDEELVRLVQRFESGVADLITSHGGRVIKSLGDELLFVADEPEIGANIACDLAEKTSRRKISGIHIGLEFGWVVSQGGDIFGDTVNLASRLTALAEPNHVLVGPALAEELAPLGGFELVALPPLDVRGFGMVAAAELRRITHSADGGT
jgi:adenylate cyclase